MATRNTKSSENTAAKKADDKSAEEKPKPRRGRPPKKKEDVKATSSAKSTAEAASSTEDKPKPRRGRPPKKKPTEDSNTKATSAASKEDSKTKTSSAASKSRAKSSSNEAKAPVETVDKPLPRRRGRPPKKKNEDADNSSQQKPEPKKTPAPRRQSTSKAASTKAIAKASPRNTAKQDTSPKTDEKPTESNKSSSQHQKPVQQPNQKTSSSPQRKSWIQQIDLTGGSKDTAPSKQDDNYVEESEEDSRFNKIEYLEGNKDPYADMRKGSGRGSRNQPNRKGGAPNAKSQPQGRGVRNSNQGNTPAQQPQQEPADSSQEDKKEDNAPKRGIRQPRNTKHAAPNKSQSPKQDNRPKEDDSKQDSKHDTSDKVQKNENEAPKRGIRVITKKEKEANQENEKDSSSSDKDLKSEAPTPDKDSKPNQSPDRNQNRNQRDNKRPANQKGKQDDSAKNKNDNTKSDSDQKQGNQRNQRQDQNKSHPRRDDDRSNKEDNSENNDKPRPVKKTKKEKVERAIYRYTPSVYSYQIQEINDFKLLDEKERKNPFIDSFLRKISTFMREKLYVDIDVRILLAVSGGIDSVVLADALAILSQEYHFKFEIAHYNHKMREGSDKDENFVRQLANSYRVSFHAGAGNVKKLSEESGMSLEEAARHLRYGFLNKVVSQTKADFVATAHNANDSAETLLMNLFRGSGLTGLSGIPAKRPFGKKAVLIRPFLNITRAEIEKYASVRKLFWVEDITNRSLDFTRNKIRHNVLPEIEKEYNPNIIQTLHRTTQILRGADEFLSEKIKEHAELAVESFSDGNLLIKKGIFNSFKDFVKGEVLQFLLNKHFDLTPLPSKQLDKILELPTKAVGSKAEVSKEITAFNQRSTILITDYEDGVDDDEPVRITGPGTYDFAGYRYEVEKLSADKVKLVPDNDTEYFDTEYMPVALHLRKRQDGDRITPLGMKGTMSVSDFLTNAKLDTIEKNDISVLSDGVEVIWICGYRMSDKYRLKKDTKEVLKITRTII